VTRAAAVFRPRFPAGCRFADDDGLGVGVAAGDEVAPAVLPGVADAGGLEC
jgi:hypothetical protein